MPRAIGSGHKPEYVSFRTSAWAHRTIMEIADRLGFTEHPKSQVYQAAEQLFIEKFKYLLLGKKRKKSAKDGEGKRKEEARSRAA